MRHEASDETEATLWRARYTVIGRYGAATYDLPTHEVLFRPDGDLVRTVRYER